jgi:NAD(P)-dependent dehydrogenase (short-subunit alcohol dehydrogenase family)
MPKTKQSQGKSSKQPGQEDQKQTRPPQKQDRQPGRESEMHPRPRVGVHRYKAAGKLEGRSAIITGGDSGIGRAVAVAFAKEGADVAVIYLNEHDDANETKRLVEAEDRKCITIAGDIGDEKFCRDAVQQSVRDLGHLDILVNNAAEQHPKKDIKEISAEQLERTFRTNIFSMFFMTKAAVEHLQGREGAAIINTTSVTAYRGSGGLIDYASTKGAIVAFTRSLSENLIEKGIRVNGVAPGPIWTPLDADHVTQHGKRTLMQRAGQPSEVAPCYVFLASADASYMTGQVLHPNGGDLTST